MNNDNRKRALAETVSLDVWHEGFTAQRDRVDLHVDVAFAEGRIGGGPGQDVHFRLRIRRAQVVVIIPPTEPAKVDKDSVIRGGPKASVESRTRHVTKKTVQGALGLTGKADVVGPSAGANVSAGVAALRVQSETVEITETTNAIRAFQVQTGDDEYAWAIDDAAGRWLLGRPWDAKEEPRLKVIDTRPDRTRGIEPNIRVEVRCRREDLEIIDVVGTDQPLFAKVLASKHAAEKLRTAEATIRRRLSEAGLIAGDMTNPFAELTLCAVIAEGQ